MANLNVYLDKCNESAKLQWEHLGTDQAVGPLNGRQGRRPGARMVSDITEAGVEHPDEDDEAEDLIHVQNGILRILDTRKAVQLTEKFRSQGREIQALRVEDLCDASQCHEWLWSLGRQKQKRLPHEEFRSCCAHETRRLLDRVGRNMQALRLSPRSLLLASTVMRDWRSHTRPYEDPGHSDGASAQG